MTKKTDKVEIKSRAGVTGMSKAFVDGKNKALNTGELIDTCVARGKQFYKGKPIPDGDLTAMVNNIADVFEWKGRSAHSRKSETRNVLAWYAQLADVCTKFRAKNDGNATWHNVVTLARNLEKNGGSIKPAVQALVDQIAAKGTPPNKLGVTESKKRAAIAINGILKMTALNKAFRAELYTCALESGKLNVSMPKAKAKKKAAKK
jgi:hypothetical protein